MNTSNDSAKGADQAASTLPRGCGFLLHRTATETIFVPEGFTDEQRMFAKTAEDFMNQEVLPIVDRLERQEEGLMRATLQKSGELGFLMIDVPEEYGGLDLDKTTSMLVSERLATYASFSVSQGGHIGIGMLPLVFFGTHEQKERYLPRLASGELLAAYALTEPGSGSDALGATSTAVLETNAAGNEVYRLNGTKMWITNAGFADLFTVFAKVDGTKFTAFLVERDTPGVSFGAEEHKMGLKGSSTRMLVLEDVVVPAQNVLGEIGRGHKIAFNVLNVGRFKLGVGALGNAKRTLRIATEYALERKQFKAPIASFGAIQEKLATMALRLYALESMSYRVAGYMDTTIEALDPSADDYQDAVMRSIEEFAIEDSIMKVFGSEAVSYVADEAVQIHGGYGYSAEYEVERTYRDVRINRIFEGTNEINRMLIPGMLLKRTMKGQLALFEVMQRAEALASGDARVEADGPLASAIAAVESAKLLTVDLANQSIQRYMADFKDQQELMLALADMIIATYAADSAVTRVAQRIATDGSSALHISMATLLAEDAHAEVLELARRIAPSLAKDEKLEALFDRIDAFSQRRRTDAIQAKRAIAALLLEQPRWPF